MNDNKTELVVAHTSSGAEERAKNSKGESSAHILVLAFNTSQALCFSAFTKPWARARPIDQARVYCGDDRSARELAARLIIDVGFDPADAGPLQIARYIEPFALLVGQLAYEGEEGPELAYRFERTGK